MTRDRHYACFHHLLVTLLLPEARHSGLDLVLATHAAIERHAQIINADTLSLANFILSNCWCSYTYNTRTFNTAASIARDADSSVLVCC